MRSLLNAYMNCRTFVLLFHPHLQQILLNSSSIWSCKNMYVRIYCNGKHSWDRYSCAVDTREWILNVNSQIAVLWWPSISFCLWSFSDNKYDNIYHTVSTTKIGFLWCQVLCNLLQIDSSCLTCQRSCQLVLWSVLLPHYPWNSGSNSEFLWGKSLKDIPESGLAWFVQPIAMQELTILTSFKDVQIKRRSKTMNINQNFGMPFDYLKIVLETFFFLSTWNFL